MVILRVVVHAVGPVFAVEAPVAHGSGAVLPRAVVEFDLQAAALQHHGHVVVLVEVPVAAFTGVDYQVPDPDRFVLEQHNARYLTEGSIYN